MRFQLPQFIETEVRLVGPFTLKQFLWLAAGAAFLTLLYIFVNWVVFIILAMPIIAVSLALAFIKIDGLPLINYLTYVISYAIGPKKYIYQKEAEPVYENLPPPEPPTNQNES